MHAMSSTILDPAASQNAPLAPSEKSGRSARVWLRRLMLVVICLVLLLNLAEAVWFYSGGNDWRFLGEQNGVKVYMLKAPGTDMEQAKGVFRVNATLAGIVSFMTSPDTCQKVGCYAQRTIEQPDAQLNYNYFRMDLPGPFRTRDFLVRQQISQTPSTKEVMIEYSAAPGRVPVDACCVRVTNMHNTWRLTPVGNGQVEIEMVMNVNEGGYIPHVLLNLVRPSVLYQLSGLQPLFSEERYRTAKLSFISEP